MMFAVRLIHRRTCDEIVLGGKYRTREEAEAYVRGGDVCLRCHSCRIFPVAVDDVWINKRVGFVSPSERREMLA